MLYRFISKAYNRKSDALVLARIVDGVYPYRVENRRGRWVFTTIVSEIDFQEFSRCL